MESKLSISEFREKLKDTTEIGSPKLKLSPFGVFFNLFGGKSKPFYGLFDDKSFRLTMNYTTSPTFFIINGTYKNRNRTFIINYNIESSPKFYLVWIKFFPIIALVLINISFFFSEVQKEVFILPNIALIFMFFFSRWDIKRKRKNIEQKFIEIFEIIK
ncbi:hypothetical protein D3C85_597050 [compost metagenome]